MAQLSAVCVINNLRQVIISRCCQRTI